MTYALAPGTQPTMTGLLLLCLQIIITGVGGQLTPPVFTINPTPITVGVVPQYTELKCQIEKVLGYSVIYHRIQRKNSDSTYTDIASFKFPPPQVATVIDAGLQSRSDAVNYPLPATSVTGSLQIRDVYCTDAATYRCLSEVFDSSFVTTYHDSTDVELQTIKPPSEIPSLSYLPSEIVENQEVQFECTANVGRPAEDLSIVINIGSTPAETLPLTYDQLSRAGDSCTQTRTARAVRSFSRYDYKAQILVQCFIVSYSSLVHELQPLDIKYGVESAELTIDNSNSAAILKRKGRQVMIRCKSDGNPTPNYKIYFIPENKTMITNEWARDILVIGSVTRDDAGTYFCAASNTLSTENFSESSQNITLTVTEPSTEAPTTQGPEPLTTHPNGGRGNNTIYVDSCDDELLRIENERLSVDTLRLGVERERLVVEQARLDLERERLQFERERQCCAS